MSKKKFIDGDVFSAMTSAQPVPPAFRQPELPAAPRSANEAGLPEGMTRATIIAPKELLEKCKDIAYWERLRDQDVYAAALQSYIAAHEQRAGRAVEPRPAHARRTLMRSKRP